MKTLLLGLAAVFSVTTTAVVVEPAKAASWKDALFTKLDTNQNKLLDRQELTAGGCDTKLYGFVDKNRDEVLTYGEFFNGRELLGRCK